MTSQKKIHSLIESVTDVGVGLVLNFSICQFILFPLFSAGVSVTANICITAVLTVVAVSRKYVVRRVFNLPTGEDTEDSPSDYTGY